MENDMLTLAEILSERAAEIRRQARAIQRDAYTLIRAVQIMRGEHAAAVTPDQWNRRSVKVQSA